MNVDVVSALFFLFHNISSHFYCASSCITIMNTMLSNYISFLLIGQHSWQIPPVHPPRFRGFHIYITDTAANQAVFRRAAWEELFIFTNNNGSLFRIFWLIAMLHKIRLHTDIHRKNYKNVEYARPLHGNLIIPLLSHLHDRAQPILYKLNTGYRKCFSCLYYFMSFSQILQT